MPKIYLKIKHMQIINFLQINFLEYIQKEKVRNALTNKELQKELLLWNILDKFMNLGDGMKDKILLNKC
jgi:hypothetical protein